MPSCLFAEHLLEKDYLHHRMKAAVRHIVLNYKAETLIVPNYGFHTALKPWLRLLAEMKRLSLQGSCVVGV